MERRKRYRIGLIAGLLGLVLVIGLGWANGSAAVGWFGQTPDEGVTRLYELDQSAGLSEDAARSVDEKLAMAERMAAEQADAAQVHTTKVPLPESAFEPAPALADVEIMDEIFEGSEGLVRPSQAAILNGWQGQRDETLYQVLAGASALNAKQGLLYVMESRLGDTGPSITVYEAPEMTGALRITAVEGNLLIMTAEDGSIWTFDLTARSFE